MASPEWTEEDRRALLALEQYEATLCPGCSNERQVAWQTDGWWLAEEHTCGACAARARAQAEWRGEDMTTWKPPVYTVVHLNPANTIGHLPPLQLIRSPLPVDD